MRNQPESSAALPPPRLEEVSGGIFAYIQPDGGWGIDNTGFVVGPEGITAIDSCLTEKRTRAFLAAIGSVADRPVRTLINTHHHADHTWGNGFFATAAILGHELCRAEALRVGMGVQVPSPNVEFGALSLVAPFVTFRDRLELYTGDLRLEVFSVGPAHTRGDVVIWIPERKVLFAGDLIFKDCTPFVLDGCIAHYLEELDRLRSLGAEVIVPGHGPVCGPEAFDETEAYLRFVVDAARRGFERGLEPLDVARQTDLGSYAEWNNWERFAANLHRAYSELRGEPPAAPLDFAQMVRAMEAYSGQPLQRRA